MTSLRAILLIDHGSIKVAANQNLEEVAAKVRGLRPDWWVAISHMELASPSLAEGVADCIRAGAVEIIVHPYFLAPGRHTLETIPKLVAEVAVKHPNIRIRISDPLGLHEKLAEVVVKRIEALVDR